MAFILRLKNDEICTNNNSTTILRKNGNAEDELPIKIELTKLNTEHDL